MSDVEKRTRIRRLREDPEVQIALCSLSMMSVGLNLECCNRVIFAELSWRCEIMLQAEDRVHRKLQTKPCSIDYVVAEKLFDKELVARLERKFAVQRRLVDNDAAGAKFIPSPEETPPRGDAICDVVPSAG